ncbi:Competence protein CoiA-like family protein [Pedobacter steynii]|uniref:Competence protein CoiA-like family protein n=1 Tax=Pedobacter steynii TaxID=430522 RepID=A0A1H0G3Q4_9SPHI|nr:DUF6035 family protein [Pedobacter steynii]NQX42313.1 hypothetical protein [Pedobacter steynii]SDO01517.1 Competence protein CoiA-like family protein [Pedobacter steynii]
MIRDRAIKLAFDQQAGIFLHADEVFANTRDAFALREQYSRRKLLCYECDEPLFIATSKFDRLFFRHGPNAGNCILKDQEFSGFELELYNNTLQAKESQRHHDLKNKIAELLKITDGVEKDSVFADTQYLFHGKEKRRPDVYCKYKGKEMVFEIQLSALSLRYILDRRDFYRKKGIYLVWILDAFDVNGQTHTERDIKYLSSYQNFFKLDEKSIEMRLVCTYKSPHLNEKNQIITPWNKRSVTLDQLQFCPEELQLYYLNYSEKLKEAEDKLEAIETETIRKAQEKQEQEYHQRSQRTVIDLMNKMAAYFKGKYNFYKFSSFIDPLSEKELVLFNQKLNFNRIYKGQTQLNHYLNVATKDDHSFISFLLKERRIEMDVNKNDLNGKSTLQQLLTNPFLYTCRNMLLPSLFKRGYLLTQNDIDFYQQMSHPLQHDIEADIVLLKAYNSLSDKKLADLIFRNSRLIEIIESFRQKKIIGTRLPGWLAVAMNLVTSHKRYWKYIEEALRYYELLDVIIAQDKKGNFQKKIAEYQLNMPVQQEDVGEMLRDLFPEVYL